MSQFPPPPIWAPQGSSEWLFWYDSLSNYLTGFSQGNTPIVLPPSTTTQAPLTLQPTTGPLVTAPTPGMIEFDGTFLYVTTGSGRAIVALAHSLNPVTTITASQTLPYTYTNTTAYDIDTRVSAQFFDSSINPLSGTVQFDRGGTLVTIGSGSPAVGNVLLSPNDALYFSSTDPAATTVTPGLTLIPR